MYEKTFPNKRYAITTRFLKEVLPEGSSILDLGVENPFSKIMKTQGYHVQNTTGEDLDVDTIVAQNTTADAVTAFEIFEHYNLQILFDNTLIYQKYPKIYICL